MTDTTTTIDITATVPAQTPPPTLLDLARAVIEAHDTAVTAASKAEEADAAAHAADALAAAASKSLSDAIAALKDGADKEAA